MSAEILAEVVNEAMELLGLPPGSTDEEFLDAIRTIRHRSGRGGHARAAKLSPERRKEIAQLAARARWAAKKGE